MMKKLTKTLLLFSLMAMLLMVSGCSGEKQPASLIGVWTLTDMTGSDDAVQSMQYYNELGMKMSMAISSDQMELVTTVGGQSEYEVVGYRIEGTQIITDASQMEYVLDGDTLSLTTGGVTMVFTRK